MKRRILTMALALAFVLGLAPVLDRAQAAVTLNASDVVAHFNAQVENPDM